MEVTVNNDAGFNIPQTFDMEGKLLKQYTLLDLSHTNPYIEMFIQFYEDKHRVWCLIYRPSISNAIGDCRAYQCSREAMALEDALRNIGITFSESINVGHDSAHYVLDEFAKHLTLKKYYIHKAQS